MLLRRTIGPLLAATIPFLAGCYRYAPIQVGEVSPGMGVRARVSLTAAQRIAPLIGASDARVLRGRLISTGDTLIVEVPVVQPADGSGVVQSLHQRIAVPRTDLIELETRQLDRTRTGGLIGIAAIILGVMLVDALNGEPGLDTPPGGGGTDAIVPVFRIGR
jgi:hypothetical protein